MGFRCCFVFVYKRPDHDNKHQEMTKKERLRWIRLCEVTVTAYVHTSDHFFFSVLLLWPAAFLTHSVRRDALGVEVNQMKALAQLCGLAEIVSLRSTQLIIAWCGTLIPSACLLKQQAGASSNGCVGSGKKKRRRRKKAVSLLALTYICEDTY